MQLNILDYLEESARTFPDKIAFSDESGCLTFFELFETSKAIGSYLIKRTSGQTGNPVAVFTERNIWSISAFLGVLYSGNFYAPIDIQTPEVRLKAMLSSLKPVASVFTDEYSQDCLGIMGLTMSVSEAISCPVDEDALKAIRNQIIDIDPAYVMFTSGSTGVPKGVVISHKSVIDLTEWLSTTFDLTNQDIIGNQTPFYFDASVKDIYITLRNACTMYIIPKKLFSSPLALVNYLSDNKINTILWATSAIKLLANFNVFSKTIPNTLKKIFFAGENMPAKQLNKWINAIPDACYINLYGPTEVTVDCAYYVVDRVFEDDESVPIGRKCANMDILLLNEELSPVNNGETGEIYVRGTGLAHGYYNDAHKTDLLFIQNPLNTCYREIVYKTGDLARYNQHGELVFVSRNDSQVKHMGMRIELGEIEVAVNAITGVELTVCFYDKEKSKIVLVYQSKEIDQADLLKALADKLPKYMFPNIIFRVDKMPENANGKIDRVEVQKGYKSGAFS